MKAYINYLTCITGLALLLGTTALHAQAEKSGLNLKSALSSADKDGDGILSAPEVAALYDLVQARTTGRTNLPGITRPSSTPTDQGGIRTPPTAPSRAPTTQPTTEQKNRPSVVRPSSRPIPQGAPSTTQSTRPDEGVGAAGGMIASERDYEVEKRRLKQDYESAKRELEQNYEAAKRDLEQQWKAYKEDRKEKRGQYDDRGKDDERGKGKGKGKAKGLDKDRE